MHDADAAEDAYLNLQPHIEKPGSVYVFLQQNKRVIGLLPTHPAGTEADCVDLKVDKAEVVDARRDGHQRQCKDIHQHLLHIRLRAMHAQRAVVPCLECGSRHCEFYGEQAAGGLEGVTGLIEARLIRLGEVPVRIPLFYPRQIGLTSLVVRSRAQFFEKSYGAQNDMYTLSLPGRQSEQTLQQAFNYSSMHNLILFRQMHYSSTSGRRKLFLDDIQEQAFIVKGGLVDAGDGQNGVLRPEQPEILRYGDATDRMQMAQNKAWPMTKLEALAKHGHTQLL
ncbi:hypothetical protein B0H17DRAFT_1145207 [Mycena rosella]|uniref:Uncharacterized protein n=1 Tax=Mycena rosella TaxID=1033263 RepID=A0AAD7CRU4_MYCRO|nr:hypothetical protein B0H17DRAFT_1145207 [Mycena rosella]